MSVKRTSYALVSLLGLSALLSSPLHAAEADSASSSPHTFTANIGVVSNYIFRGLTQTWNKPALQAGADYSHADGWYAGVWGSSITDKQYGDGWVELDLYGGYNGKFNDDWSWTVGLLGVYYPGAEYPGTSQSYDNVEVNAGIGYKWITAKLSVAVTDYFGANKDSGYKGGSSGTTYWDLTANIPLPEETFSKDVTLPVHVGRTNYTSDTAAGVDPSYTDYKVGINKTFDGGWNVGVAYTYASNGALYDNTASLKNANDKIDLGGSNVVLNLTKTF
ncbi:TorF family putative porin [Candidatus Magnetaquicoccus inordinatus]|uniref:TorF family putative porin n=1 Tax=Candidatus Magnetaquicoccus inordinatus TaxID=2496818 RepID=UPI00102CBC58|nr:TorF family putative porin [Candidatus Magnetaquicoccus inordinatus]